MRASAHDAATNVASTHANASAAANGPRENKKLASATGAPRQMKPAAIASSRGSAYSSLRYAAMPSGAAVAAPKATNCDATSAK